MLKKISLLILTILTFSFGLSVVSVQPVLALEPQEQACEALGVASDAGPSERCDDNPAGPNVNNTLRLAINVLSFIVGFAAIIMVIVGGFKYIISNGDSSNINSAKNTILYALVGLIFVALAQIIVKFVLTRSTQLPPCTTTLTTDCEPQP